MTKEELKQIVKKYIDGQGNQVDTGGVLPILFGSLIDKAYEVDGVQGEIGDLAELLTEHKSNIVEAINEVSGLVESEHFEVSFSKTSEELQEIYNACMENITLAKNIVFFNANDNLYYRVNGYAFVGGVLKLHTIMQGDGGLVDTVVNIAANGTISVG